MGEVRNEPGPGSGLSEEAWASALICGSMAFVGASMFEGDELRGPIISIPEMCLFSA